MSQSNVQTGDILVNASEAIAAGRLVTLINTSNVLEAALPNSATDEMPFVCVDAAAEDENAILRPLTPGQSARVRLNGTCVPADQLVAATPDGTEDGKVIALPDAAGTYRLIGIAEEVGVDEQLVKLRPVGQRLITVI